MSETSVKNELRCCCFSVNVPIFLGATIYIYKACVKEICSNSTKREEKSCQKLLFQISLKNSIFTVCLLLSDFKHLSVFIS